MIKGYVKTIIFLLIFGGLVAGGWYSFVNHKKTTVENQGIDENSLFSGKVNKEKANIELEAVRNIAPAAPDEPGAFATESAADDQNTEPNFTGTAPVSRVLGESETAKTSDLIDNGRDIGSDSGKDEISEPAPAPERAIGTTFTVEY